MSPFLFWSFAVRLKINECVPNKNFMEERT